MQTRIGVRVFRVGWHRWPDASGTRAYLKDLHRHTFHLVVEMDVHHDDREVEFHDLRDLITEWWGDERDQDDRGSCEQIAADLRREINSRLPGRAPSVRVSEDGEAWAHVQDH